MKDENTHGIDFKLVPFPNSACPPDITIYGKLRVILSKPSITFILHDPDACLDIPPTIKEPERIHELWQETCFEWFLSPSGSKRYWEFNISPTGDWNVYRFSDYRQEMTTEGELSLAVTSHREATSLIIKAEFDLARLSLMEQKLDIGISAVVKEKTGRMSFWALTHLAEKADFHLRNSFTLAL
jgi:hypothetical protein